jgi:hypothetical protein
VFHILGEVGADLKVSVLGPLTLEEDLWVIDVVDCVVSQRAQPSYLQNCLKVRSVQSFMIFWLWLQQRQVLLLVSEKDLADNGKTLQTYLMLLQLDELEFRPLSVPTATLNRLSLLHLCSSLVSLILNTLHCFQLHRRQCICPTSYLFGFSP